MSANTIPWGADSEHGKLLDVLVCPPDNFRWLPTSPISKATLESGQTFDPAVAARQHAEMVACYEQEGVHVHYLEADASLPYQVFARDSSTALPDGGVVLGLNQSWRRGEWSAVVDFHRDAGIPISGVITAGAVEGGDVMIIEPGCVLIGYCDVRTEEAGARQLAGFFEAQGWEARVQQFPSPFVHMDVLVATAGEKLATACTEIAPCGLIKWLEAKGFDLIDVSEEEANRLGVNVMPIAPGVVISAAGSTRTNEALRARGIRVLDPDLSMFTLGGGGAHCLAQALRRDRLA